MPLVSRRLQNVNVHICCPSPLIFAAAPQTSHIRCLSMPQVAGRLFQIAELGQNVKFDTLARAGDLSPPQWRSFAAKYYNSISSN